ncbi:MAG: YtxH domain-containing protein [Microscillaceae bacterium]|nr:YtxH domain-containing protein [Microscillaceae bacterium]
MNDNTKVFIGFLTGLAAGVITGVLLAPDKGDETRKMLAERAKSLGSDVSAQFDHLGIDKINEAAKEIANRAIEAVNKILKKEAATPDNNSK